MAWETPTLADLVTRQQRALAANLPGADATLARANLEPVSKVLAGGLYELHLAQAEAIAQRFVLTCRASFLDRHGAEMKPPVPRKPAASARGLVDIVALGPITLATGAVLARADGQSFTVDAGIVLDAAGSSVVAVTAQTPGVAGNAAPFAVLNAASGLTGTASFTVAAGGLGGGADPEQDAPYRARLLFAKAFPEHAGAPADWLRYTLAVPGVTRAFLDPLALGRGTVVVYPFFDEARANGTPLESDRLAVEQALAIAGPGAGLGVVRIATPVTVDVEVTGLSPATPEVRNAVVAELAFTFARQSRVAGLSDPHPSMPYLASAESFSQSWIWQAVANASGEQRHSIVTPAADIALTEGQTAVLGTVTFS